MGVKHRLWTAAEHWILPPAVAQGVARTVRRLMPIPAWQRALLRSNVRLNGAYRGRRCFVIANGPSLARTDIAPLGGEVTLVMNHFNRHPEPISWEPTIHLAAEPASFYVGDAGIEFLRDLVSGYQSTTHVFPIEMDAMFRRTEVVPPDRLVLVRQDGRLAQDFDRIDLTGAVPAAHDTSILAVSVAIAIGCNPIILLGLDYDWLIRGPMAHFYPDEVEPQAPIPSSATYPDLAYLDKIELTAPRWRAHAALGRIAARTGQVILNATPGSYLDVYPMTSLGEILGADNQSD